MISCLELYSDFMDLVVLMGIAVEAYSSNKPEVATLVVVYVTGLNVSMEDKERQDDLSNVYYEKRNYQFNTLDKTEDNEAVPHTLCYGGSQGTEPERDDIIIIITIIIIIICLSAADGMHLNNYFLNV